MRCWPQPRRFPTRNTGVRGCPVMRCCRGPGTNPRSPRWCDIWLWASSHGSRASQVRTNPTSEARPWAGGESSVGEGVRHLALGKLPWLASIAGEDEPDLGGEVDAVSLRRRHSEISVRWLAMTRDVERRGAWGDRVIDALCDPP